MTKGMETVSRPYRYKKTEDTDTDLRRDKDKNEKENLRAQSAKLAHHAASELAATSPGLGMKGSKLLTRQRKWQIQYPEKRRAHEAVKAALRSGRLVKGACAECGSNQFIDAHHENYAQPLQVTWLCRRHHAARHRRKIVKGPKS